MEMYCQNQKLRHFGVFSFGKKHLHSLPPFFDGMIDADGLQFIQGFELAQSHFLSAGIRVAFPHVLDPVAVHAAFVGEREVLLVLVVCQLL